MHRQIQRLQKLAAELIHCASIHERIAVLDRDPIVMQSTVQMQHCDEKHIYILKSLLAIEQHHVLAADSTRRDELLAALLPVESFYREIGGIVGYHLTLCSLLHVREAASHCSPEIYHCPLGIDISCENAEVKRYIQAGIAALPHFAEIFPVGGAADRLQLCDPITQIPLPAAKLTFCKRTLLEGLIRDVIAKEYLYYKIHGEKIVIPIAMMTSEEKDNHRQILSICEENKWFGRPKESFRLFCQPLVPTIERDGTWCLNESLQLMMKPGGHGAIWKLAEDLRIFAWLESLRKSKLLIRQINNPIASVDYGVLAFCGIGYLEKKKFGFASCLRQIQSAEGVNIVIEKKQTEYCLTNIEYCDFKKYGIKDVPQSEGSAYSQYPSNTNILFCDLAAIREKIKECPIPGMLVNLKKMTFVDADGNVCEKEVARLESMMQNIADCFVETDFPADPLSHQSFLTYQSRQKTISTTKRAFQGGSLLETPEGCYYDLLSNARDLLSVCNFSLPPVQNAEDYLQQGPSFIFEYHPALGPLYSIIAQKMQGGAFAPFSELILEIAEVHVNNLQVAGSLHVIAAQPTQGRCVLKNVSVKNEGIDRTKANCYWSGEIERKEVCVIVIEEGGEFYAENITFSGSFHIVVKPNTRVTAYMVDDILRFKEE